MKFKKSYFNIHQTKINTSKMFRSFVDPLQTEFRLHIILTNKETAAVLQPTLQHSISVVLKHIIKTPLCNQQFF